MLNLRPVTQDDIKLLFKWANDPEVRLNSFNSKEIKWDEHQKWFKVKIESDSAWLILEKNEIPIL